MTTRYFTKDHEWLLIDNGIATIGITDYAQQQLGDLVFIDLPKPNQNITKDQTVVVVESVKAASDVYAPIDGIVTEINHALGSNPGLINHAPETEGWLWKMSISDEAQLAELLSPDAYRTLIG